MRLKILVAMIVVMMAVTSCGPSSGLPEGADKAVKDLATKLGSMGAGYIDHSKGYTIVQVQQGKDAWGGSDEVWCVLIKWSDPKFDTVPDYIKMAETHWFVWRYGLLWTADWYSSTDTFRSRNCSIG